MRTPPDRELVQRCLKGDRAAMDELVDRHHESVLNFAARYVGRGDEARDLAQEVFVKVIRRLDTFDDRADFGTWLFAITANTCRDALRRRKRQREVREADGPELHVITERTPDDGPEGAPALALERSVRAQPIRDAVAELPEPHRTTIILRYFHEMSLREIAEACQCTVGTVGSRLHYAIKRLRAALTPEADGTGGDEDELHDGQDSAAGARGT